VEGLALVEVPACLKGPALEEAAWRLELVAEVDHECSVDMLVLSIAVWRRDGEFGSELTVIGVLMSIASF